MHPRDADLFSPSRHETLRRAAADFAFLLEKGYAWRASLKLVGDHFSLTARQREAVRRSACAPSRRRLRNLKRLPPDRLRNGTLLIDGFNVLTTLEAALSGGVLLIGQDGCLRDIASMHGNYHQIPETLPALGLLLHYLESLSLGAVRFLFDQPVSNSGRLAQTLRQMIVGLNLPPTWGVDVVGNPDPVLKESEHPVATADGIILDRCQQWFNLARETVAWGRERNALSPALFIVDLGQENSCHQDYRD